MRAAASGGWSRRLLLLGVSLFASRLTAQTAAARSTPADAPAAEGAAARCEAYLRSATADSASVQLETIVQPATGANLPGWYEQLIGTGIREQLRLPMPLVLDTYVNASIQDQLIAMARRLTSDQAAVEPPPSEARPTLRGRYEVSLQADGHLRGAQVAGGVQDSDFDAAVLRAIAALDSSGELPPLPKGVDADRGGRTLQIEITERPSDQRGDDASLGVAPLLAMRLPRLRVSQAAVPYPDQPAPRYPEALMQNHVDGSVLLEFVISAVGRAEMGTVRVLRATRPEFVRAVLYDLPMIRFKPLAVGPGCAVRTVVRMPFAFTTQ